MTSPNLGDIRPGINQFVICSVELFVVICGRNSGAVCCVVVVATRNADGTILWAGSRLAHKRRRPYSQCISPKRKKRKLTMAGEEDLFWKLLWKSAFALAAQGSQRGMSSPYNTTMAG